MAITIHEALQLPVMSQTKLVAGLDGLHNIIKWVTIVEVIDDSNRLQEGEFLITTGFDLMHNDQKFAQFLALLADKKLSGVALYTGFYISEIPESFIQAANKADLPLIEIPTEINFSMITKEILQQIVNKQFKMLEHSVDIHKEFTQLVLLNEGIQAITDSLSRLTKGSVILFDQDLGLTSGSLLHEEVRIIDRDKLFVQSTEFLLAPDQLSPQTIPMDGGYTAQLHPVIANRINCGWILTIKEQEEWKEIDQIAIEHASTVYAIEFLRHKAIADTEIRLQGEFLDQILQYNFTGTAEAIERGKKLGLDLTLDQVVMLIQMDRVDHDLEKHNLNETLYRLVSQTVKNNNRQSIARNRTDSCIVLMESPLAHSGDQSKDDTIKIARQIYEKWHSIYPKFPLRIGIGSSCDELTRLSQSAKEAHYALILSPLLPANKAIVHYDDLGLYHLLIEMWELGMDLDEFANQHIGPLLSNKRTGQGADLVLTLESYLHNNYTIQQTAAELFVHRHTLKYRLNQIEKKTGLSLASSENRIKLQLATMAYRLSRIVNDNGSLTAVSRPVQEAK